jgi:hypothetical protein
MKEVKKMADIAITKRKPAIGLRLSRDTKGNPFKGRFQLIDDYSYDEANSVSIVFYVDLKRIRTLTELRDCQAPGATD